MSIIGGFFRALGRLAGIGSRDAPFGADDQEEQLLDQVRWQEEVEQPHHHDEDCD